MKKAISYLLPFLVVLALWQLVTQLGLWSSYILPSPERVCATAQKLLQSGELAKHTAISLRRILLGFVCAFGLSCLFSAVGLLFPRLRAAYSGLLEVFRHVPPLSLIPLLILWFGIGDVPKAIVIILASFFPIYLNMDDGFRRCDPKLLEVGRILGMNRWTQLRKIRLPAALPGILTGMKVGMGYSLRAIIGAEMIAADSGLGYLILDAQAMSRSDKVIIGILTIGALGLVLDGAFTLLTWLCLPWERRRL